MAEGIFLLIAVIAVLVNEEYEYRQEQKMKNIRPIRKNSRRW